MLAQILFENSENGPRETTAASTTLDPMISRLQELAGRPTGDADYQKLKNEISRNGWQKFLANTRPSNTASIYNYIAKADGRKAEIFKFACSDHLPGAEGNLEYREEPQCGLLADHFESRLSATEHKYRGGQIPRSAELERVDNPRQSRGRRCDERKQFEEISLIEFVKAASELAAGRRQALTGSRRKCSKTCQLSGNYCASFVTANCEAEISHQHT